MAAKGRPKALSRLFRHRTTYLTPSAQAVDGLLRRHRQKNAHLTSIRPFIAIKNNNKYVYTRDATKKSRGIDENRYSN